MKMHKQKFILLFFGIINLSSCTKLLYTSLDVLRPAKVEFNTEANNLSIINNTVIQPQNVGHKTILLDGKTQNISVLTDSLAIFCLTSMTEELESKGFFQTVKLKPNTINNSKEFSKPEKLSNENVVKICNLNNTNVVLSLDRIKVSDDLKEYYLAENSTYLNSLEVKFETNWSIHYLNNSDVKTVNFKDTLYWETESYSRMKASSELPSREDALIDGALEIGRKSVNRFIPYWEKVDRYFFSSENKMIKRGLDSIYVKNWDSAIDLWKSVFQITKSSMIQAKAANNIAVAYEITGDINNAIDYATKALYSYSKLTIIDYQTFIRLSEYLNELNKRKNEIRILKKQLGD